MKLNANSAGSSPSKEVKYTNSFDFAAEMDELDELAKFRSRFHIPKHTDGSDTIYFTGNSLGLQPKTVAAAIEQELTGWAALGVAGHHRDKDPWVDYHESLAQPLAMLTGAKELEVVAMNNLTTNIHLLLASFYQPRGNRCKVICEAKAFPSDQYALRSHLELRGIDPDDAIVELHPREGEHYLRTDEIIDIINAVGDELALVFLGGVNYYSGEVVDMEAITKAGKQAGAMVGFDLAHAIGNIPLQLHDWAVDFACWCSYKYLNSGPGGVAGAFVHEQYFNNKTLQRLAGWWGNDKKTRFQMLPEFEPIQSAEGWQLSNAPILSMAAHKAALKLFEEAGMKTLTKKSEQLTGYLIFLLDKMTQNKANWQIITPRHAHGCQLSLLFHKHGRQIFDALTAAGVVADWREPNVIRVAPVPLYNSFKDIWNFGQILNNIVTTL